MYILSIVRCMELKPTPELLNSLYWITLTAVIVSSASAVLKAGEKQFDLFGVIMIAIATGLGGGSLRDMLLDREVFWIRDQIFFTASIVSALVIFALARLTRLPDKLFLFPDAAGLATFGIAGTLVALMFEADWLVASFMGVMTAVVGGIFRDVLCNETPLVFHGPVYATVCWLGSLLFIGLIKLEIDTTIAAISAGITIFIFRLLAIRYDIHLPRFASKMSK